jgi:hypothetical protein
MRPSAAVGRFYEVVSGRSSTPVLCQNLPPRTYGRHCAAGPRGTRASRLRDPAHVSRALRQRARSLMLTGGKSNGNLRGHQPDTDRDGPAVPNGCEESSGYELPCFRGGFAENSIGGGARGMRGGLDTRLSHRRRSRRAASLGGFSLGRSSSLVRVWQARCLRQLAQRGYRPAGGPCWDQEEYDGR